MIKFFFTPAIAGLVALMAVAGSAVAQNAKPASPLSGAQVLQGKWVKVCGAEAPGRMCMTTIDAFMTLKGVEKPLWLATAAVREIADTKTKSILFRVPLQVRLKEGMLIRIDDSKISRVEFEFCQDVGCWVVLPANDQMIARFKKGKQAIIQFSDMRGKTHQIEITLAGFTKVFQGKPSKILALPAANVPAPARTTSKKGDAPAQ